MQLIKIFILMLVAMSAYADPSVETALKGEAGKPPQDDIEKVIELPIDGMNAVVKKNGEILFISKNGRYVIRGTLMDVWSTQTLVTEEEVSRNVRTLDLDALQFDEADLHPIVIGKGDKVVNVFTDPVCPACRDALKEMEALSEEYTFKLYLVPVIKPQSNELIKSLYCASADKALKALLSNDYTGLPKPTCDFKQLGKRLWTADFLQVRHVPFIVSPSHLVSRGKPALPLKEWLTSSQAAE